jgi:hypothetical protein
MTGEAGLPGIRGMKVIYFEMIIALYNSHKVFYLKILLYSCLTQHLFLLGRHWNARFSRYPGSQR